MKKMIYKGTLGGGCSAKVYLDFGNYGSSVEFPDEKEPYCKVTIGCAFADWSEVFDGIMHEMMEFHMMNMELAYQRWYRAGCDTGDIWFHFSHADYSELISRASQSILCFHDKAREEYNKYVQTQINKQKKVKEIKEEKPKKKKTIEDNPSNESI